MDVEESRRRLRTWVLVPEWLLRPCEESRKEGAMLGFRSAESGDDGNAKGRLCLPQNGPAT